MGTTTSPISVDEYLSTSYRPDCDYLDGVLLERNVGQWDHSQIQTLLAVLLYPLRATLNARIGVEQRVRVGPRRFRIPDVCVVLGGAPGEQILTRPPFLCIEILSPDDRMSEMQERIQDYLDFGVPYVWVLDPRKQRGFVYTKSGMTEPADGALKTDKPAITVSLSDLFGASV